MLWQPTTEGPGDPAWDGVLPSDSVYMIWLNAASAQKYAVNGSDVVYTTPFYVAGMGSNGWLSVYNAQIMPTGLTAGQQKHVLGAEICMWGESLDAGNLGVRAFQIGAAAAENFWANHTRVSLSLTLFLFFLTHTHTRTDSLSPPLLWQAQGPGSALGLGVSDRYNRFLCHLRRFGIDFFWFPLSLSLPLSGAL